MRRGLLSIASLALLLVVTACEAPPGREESAAAAWTRAITALRASADRAVQDQDLATAEGDLSRALALPAPERLEARLLTQDLHFARGTVHFARRDPAAALASCDAGLAAGPRDSVFAANLYALRGMVLEATGQALPAAEAYTEALRIHKAHYDAALEAP